MYDPDPKLGANLASPVIRFVVLSTEIVALSWREFDRSVRSSKINGLVVLSLGNWKRNRDVWCAVVISTRTPDASSIAKYPGRACTESGLYFVFRWFFG